MLKSGGQRGIAPSANMLPQIPIFRDFENILFLFFLNYNIKKLDKSWTVFLLRLLQSNINF